MDIISKVLKEMRYFPAYLMTSDGDLSIVETIFHKLDIDANLFFYVPYLGVQKSKPNAELRF